MISLLILGGLAIAAKVASDKAKLGAYGMVPVDKASADKAMAAEDLAAPSPQAKPDTVGTVSVSGTVFPTPSPKTAKPTQIDKPPSERNGAFPGYDPATANSAIGGDPLGTPSADKDIMDIYNSLVASGK